ncbi:MAG: STM4015 family protein [Capsulimonas sp.]|uniref:STM4015 family protein n=1 Tax=Capsulimonas sp. TaxID=2494211 RepID=UPI003265E410
MAIYEHLQHFDGKPVVDWELGTPLTGPGETAYRISISWEEHEAKSQWTDKFAQFLTEPGVEEVTALIVGPWEGAMESDGSSEAATEAIVAAREQLPNLKAVFVGEILAEEAEISWIQQSDLSALFNAYPLLETFYARGGNGLHLGSPTHDHLKTLVVQSGGLDVEVVREVAGASLSALEHLELWLGTENYGATTTVDDVLPILNDNLFPSLKYLGLCDSEIADAIAAAIATAPILDQLEVLDLSLGTLSDEGALALIAAPSIGKLRSLDIHHHYVSPEVVDQLLALPVSVDATSPESAADEDDRYVAVSE